MISPITRQNNLYANTNYYVQISQLPNIVHTIFDNCLLHLQIDTGNCNLEITVQNVYFKISPICVYLQD